MQKKVIRCDPPVYELTSAVGGLKVTKLPLCRLKSVLQINVKNEFDMGRESTLKGGYGGVSHVFIKDQIPQNVSL